LLFRSQAEIHLYRALKAANVSFAPLAVFVRGGQKYRRIEPDFFIIHKGVPLVVEVDGDTVHQETPAEAHARTAMLGHEGVYIERILASECDTPDKAMGAASKILATIEKHIAARK
jgi:very-short-patch-repair endonuclease